MSTHEEGGREGERVGALEESGELVIGRKKEESSRHHGGADSGRNQGGALAECPGGTWRLTD